MDFHRRISISENISLRVYGFYTITSETLKGLKVEVGFFFFTGGGEKKMYPFSRPKSTKQTCGHRMRSTGIDIYIHFTGSCIVCAGLPLFFLHSVLDSIKE